MAGRSPKTCPAADLNRDEAKVLALAIDPAPDRTYCTTWDFTDKQGNFRRVGFVARTAMETVEDGTEHLIARAMNLVGRARRGRSCPPTTWPSGSSTACPSPGCTGRSST